MSYQSYLQLFDGKLNLAMLRFLESNNINDIYDNKKIGVNQESSHDLFTFNLNQELNHYLLNLDLGYEYWAENLNKYVNYDKDKIDLGTINYTVNVEVKEGNS